MTESNNLSFEVIEGWEQLPAGYAHQDVCGVAVDSRDRVYIINRGQPRLMIYERDGSFVGSWGEDLFTPRTHGVTIGPNDEVYCVDEGNHVIYKFTQDGDLLMAIGNNGVAADTGYDGSSLPTIARGGPPFNRPTNLSVAPNGELYVSDGYGNSRVHRFDAGGELIQSWGEPGTEPGQFNLPHGILVGSDSRVWVADRENDRLQIFSPDGEFIDQWTQVQRPSNLQIVDGLVYVSEMAWRPGQHSFRLGDITEFHHSRVTVFDLDGDIVTRFGGGDPYAAGNFVAAHDICVDSHGDVYVGEVTFTFGVSPGLVPADCHMFQKFRRVGSA